jgi:hypothetical protein
MIDLPRIFWPTAGEVLREKMMKNVCAWLLKLLLLNMLKAA